MKRSLSLAAALVALAGCAAERAPEPILGVVIPARDTVPRPAGRAPRDAPPPPGPVKPYRFPAAVWAELPSGLRVATLPGKGLPVVSLRVVVLAGTSADGERPGLAGLTAQLLADGGAGALPRRELVARLAALGATLSVETGPDSTMFGVAVTREHLAEALGLLASVVQRPQLSAVEFEKLKQHETERLTEAARTRATWGATMVMHRDLFAMPSEHHPYASWGPTPSEVTHLTLADCRAFHRRFYVPKGTFVVVAGDAAPEAAREAVTRAFGVAPGAEAPVISFTDPMPQEARKITLVDQPGSALGHVLVGALGPERTDKRWAAFEVASEVLRGAARAERHTMVTELAHGPSVIVTHAVAEPARVGAALAGLLEDLARAAETAPADGEVEAAARQLTDAFAVRLGAPGAVADTLTRLHVLGLPDDHADAYRKELGEITPALALQAAGEHLHRGHEVIVVEGDAAVIGPALSRFGEVKVVDPTRDFARVRSLPASPDAPR